MTRVPMTTTCLPVTLPKPSYPSYDLPPSKYVSRMAISIVPSTKPGFLFQPCLQKLRAEAHTFTNFPDLLQSVGKTNEDGNVSIFTKDGVTEHKEEERCPHRPQRQANTRRCASRGTGKAIPQFTQPNTTQLATLCAKQGNHPTSPTCMLCVVIW